VDTPGVNTSEKCLKAEVVYRTIKKINKIIDEATARTPATITSYTRLLAAGELAKGAINISLELMRDLCGERE
jgi:hypothetical protein